MRKILLVFVFVIIFVNISYAGWERVYGGCEEDLGYSVAQTRDGGYIITGYSDSYTTGSNDDYYLIRTDANGDTLWTRTYGGTPNDWAYSVAQTDDDGFIIAGRSYESGVDGGNVFIVKTDSNGDTMWTRTYGGPELDEARYISPVPGGYIVVGYTNSFGTDPGGYYDVYLLKLNEDGDTIWTRTHGGELDDGCFAGADKTLDGGYIIAGKTNTYGAGNGDIYLVKVDALGHLVWQNAYGGTECDEGWAVTEVVGGGFVAVGFTASFGLSSEDIYLVRTDAVGDTLWTRTYGDEYCDRAYSVKEVIGEGFMVAGIRGTSTGYDVWMLMLDYSGDTLWTRTYGGEEDDHCYAAAKTADGGFIMTGMTVSERFSPCGVDVYLVKTDSLGFIDCINDAPAKPTQFSMEVYPNPFNSSIKISLVGALNLTPIQLEIYDINGRKVGELERSSVEALKRPGSPPSLNAASVSDRWSYSWSPPSSLSSGIYFIKATFGNNSISKKVVYLK